MNLWILNGEMMEDLCKQVEMNRKLSSEQTTKQWHLVAAFMDQIKNEAIKVNDNYGTELTEELVPKKKTT